MCVHKAGEKTHDRSQKSKWDRLAEKWVLTGPPAAPSQEDIENYRYLLTSGIDVDADSQVLLLGCTPTLRAMLASISQRARITTTCIDISERMYEKTSDSLSNPHLHERFICGDWLNLEPGDVSYSAVLGDKVVDNVSPKDWNRFFGALHAVTSETAILVLHLAPQNMTLRGESFPSLFARWAQRYHVGKDSLSACISGLWEELLGASAFEGDTRHETQRIGRFESEVDSFIVRYGQLESADRRVLDGFLDLFWESKDDIWSSYDFETILEVMHPFFVRESTVHSTDYSSASHQPIIRARRRSLAKAGDVSNCIPPDKVGGNRYLRSTI